MSKYTSPLDEVRVAAPCPADWGKMVGDERVRYCGSCELHVYNLSGMTRREAEALVTSTEGRLCVRYYRRPDGTILTRNCPVGLSAVRRRVARVAGSALSVVVAFFAGLGINFGIERVSSPSIMEESAVPAPDVVWPQFGYGSVEPSPPHTGPEATEGFTLVAGMMTMERPPSEQEHPARGRHVKKRWQR